jgi:type I restriction enzyme S subunit
MSADWQTVKLEDIAEVERGKFSVRPRNDPRYFGGDIPFLQTGDVTGASGIIFSYSQTLNKEGLGVSKFFPAGTLLITIAANIGDVAEVMFGFACTDSLVAVQPKKGINKNWLKYFLQTQKSYFKSRATTNAQANINLQIIKPLPVLLPPEDEQIAIAFLLATWDQTIEKTERLIAAKEQRYTWLLSRLISNDDHPQGQIRNFATEVSKRHNGSAIDRVLSVTNNRGFVLPEDQFERRVASSDLNNYKIVTRGQYAYNPSRINVGSIARLDTWDTGVLSPMYVVFKIDEQKANSGFFLHWLSSHKAKERIRKSAQGSVRETVSFADLGAIPFPLPPLEQQKKIAEIINNARQEIDLLEKVAGAYRKQKRGLMKKLLTGQWKVKISEGV